MKIIDKRKNVLPLLKSELRQGQVYKWEDDPDGVYLLMTDENSLVNVSEGIVYNLEDCYPNNAVFYPVNATLEIE